MFLLLCVVLVVLVIGIAAITRTTLVIVGRVVIDAIGLTAVIVDFVVIRVVAVTADMLFVLMLL